MPVEHAYDVTSQTFFGDPYRTLRRMREEDPVQWHEPLGVWLVARYADADAVVRDERRLRNPDQRARLRAEPTRIKGAVEEWLRCEPSVVVTNRRAAEDVALGGKTIREGQTLRARLEVPHWKLLNERVAYGPCSLSDRGPSALRLVLSG
jgi:cytochrome P450